MTKKELLDILEKYDDQNEVDFRDRVAEIYYIIDSVEESVEDYQLTLNLRQL